MDLVWIAGMAVLWASMVGFVLGLDKLSGKPEVRP